jgi:Carboxypeptidase regulatory-like domain
MTLHVLGMTVLLLVGAATSFAQQTTGEVVGRIVDQQSAAVPGATITARNPDTGFVRTEVSDAEGLYRLTALPVAFYDITAELQGF